MGGGHINESSFYGPRFSKDDYVNKGVPTLMTTDFTDKGKISLKNPPLLKLSADQIEKFKVVKDDILITRTGSIGTMAIFKESYVATPSAYLIRFRFSQLMLADFIFLF